MRVEALVYPACRVFQSPRLRVQFVKARERGVEVCLVEDFAAVDQVAVDHQNVDLAPLGFEALVRSPMRRMGDDRSEVAQPMHGLDVDSTSDVRSHQARMYRGQLTWRERVPSRWSTFTQSGVVEGARAG